MAKRRVSKKLQEYRKARKAYMERRRYWKKKGVDVGEAIARVEKPTKADIRELQQSLTKTSEKVVAFKEAIKTEIPTVTELLYDHLMSVIEEAEAGASTSVAGQYGADWVRYKADLVRNAIAEIVKTDFRVELGSSPLLEKIDSAIERFLYDSGNKANSNYEAYLQQITIMIQQIVNRDDSKQVFTPMTYDGEEFFDPETGEILT